MKKTEKEFLILDLKQHAFELDQKEQCFYSEYHLCENEEKWFGVLFEEISDFIEEYYGKKITWEEKNYNGEFHLKLDFDNDFLERNNMNMKDMRNEISFIAKTILQEKNVYPSLEKENIYYTDQYNKRMNILYTNLCVVKYENEKKPTIMFTNLIKKLQKIAPINVIYNSNNTVNVSYEGYALDFEYFKKDVEIIMEEEKISPSKIAFSEPMLKESSVRYPFLEKWANKFKDFYDVKYYDKNKKGYW